MTHPTATPIPRNNTDNPPKKLAFIGLGVMGGPIAAHLATAGYAVKVYNRTRAKAEAWHARFGGEIAASPADAAREADIVFSCVGNDDDLRTVTIEPEGAFAQLAQGSIFIDHSTVSAALARELYSAAELRGAGFLDAPISGGQAGAENGTLSCMLGGAQKTYEIARPVLAQYCKMTKLMGPAGAGQQTKMVNQICIAGLLQGLSEALFFSENVGLDSKAVLEVISQGAAQSWQLDNRGATMVDGEFDFGFAVDWMRKDLDIALQAAQATDINLPVTALVDSYYAKIQELGGNRWDTSSLIVNLRTEKR